MIGAAQLRSARALLGIDQRQLATMSGLSLPTIQGMEASTDIIREDIDSLMKLVTALDSAGIEFISPGAASLEGGRGVRFFGEEKSDGMAGAGDWISSRSRAA